MEKENNINKTGKIKKINLFQETDIELTECLPRQFTVITATFSLYFCRHLGPVGTLAPVRFGRW